MEANECLLLPGDLLTDSCVLCFFQALQRYKTQSKSTESSDYEAMVAADSYFSNEAEASIRQGSDWDYQAERSSLQVSSSCTCKGRGGGRGGVSLSGVGIQGDGYMAHSVGSWVLRLSF